MGTYVLHVSRSSTDRPAGSRFGRLGITFRDSVTNTAGPGNDLVVSDEELLVTSVGDEAAFAAFYQRHARPLAGFSCGAPATPSWRPT
jgi:hypothetical protein